MKKKGGQWPLEISDESDSSSSSSGILTNHLGMHPDRELERSEQGPFVMETLFLRLSLSSELLTHTPVFLYVCIGLWCDFAPLFSPVQKSNSFLSISGAVALTSASAGHRSPVSPGQPK